MQEIGHDFAGGLEDSTADSAEEKSVTYPKNMVSPVREKNLDNEEPTGVWERAMAVEDQTSNENFRPAWTTTTHSRSILWSLLSAFLQYFSLPHRLASSKPQEKDSRDWLSADEFARSTGLISNRVTRLEEEFSILSSTCGAAAKAPALDPSTERIKALEAELAETKKHMKEVLAKQEDLVNELEQMKEHHKKKEKPIRQLHCWGA